MRIAFLLIALAGCTHGEIYENYYGEAEVLGVGNGTVQVRSGFSVDPAPAARRGCGGPAEFLRSQKMDDQGFYSVSYWRCS